MVMGEDCDLTAYRLRLLMGEGKVRYWGKKRKQKKQWKSTEKLEGIESQALCPQSCCTMQSSTHAFSKENIPAV